MATLHGAAHRVLDHILDADHPVPDAVPPAEPNGQDSGQAGVPIAAAAAALGLSVEAVRKRVRRGTLRASKVGGEWRVVLPAGLDDSLDATASAGQDGQDDQAGNSLDDGCGTGQDTGLDASRPELIDQLRGEVAWLRQRLEEAETAQAEMRRLLLAHAPGTRVLAGPETPPESHAATPARRPWWYRLVFRVE